jgi:carbamoyltransferase
VQRVDAESDPALATMILSVSRATGCPALACFPLASGDEPVVAVPGDAIRVWRRAGLDALVLGAFVIQRPTG